MVYLCLMDVKEYNSGVTLEDYLSLHILRDNGIETVPDFDLNVTSLNKDKNNHLFKQFFNTGDGGVTFKVSAYIRESDTWNGKSVIQVLDKWFKNVTVLRVATDALDVPSGEYIITKNPNRKQTFESSTQWELEFTTYTPLEVYRYANNNKAILKALKKANKKSSKKNKSTYKQKLRKCNYKTLVYSRTKKKVKCVLYMQKILYKKGFLKKAYVDGWFGSETTKAVKRFQKKYRATDKKISHHLAVSGKVDKKTWEALCK